MTCPKCESERVQTERYFTYVEEIMLDKHSVVVRCENCGHRARHDSYNVNVAMELARKKFQMIAEEK